MYSARTPLTFDYIILVAIGILASLGVLCWSIVTFPDYAIWSIILVPPIFTPIYCLIVSSYTKKKEIVSPVYLMVFDAFVALVTTAIIYRDLSGMLLIPTLLSVLVIYFLWIGASPYFQLFVRFLLGAYGEIKPLEENLISYEVSSRPEDILFQIKEKKWLGLLCGMSVKENKSGKGEVKLRLKKLGTNLYLVIYGVSIEEGKTLLNIAPYAISENLRRKDILSNKEIKEFLAPQIGTITKRLGMAKIEKKKVFPPLISLVPETIEYALYPARFPIATMQGHKIELGVIAFVGVLIMALTSLRLSNVINDTLLIGLSGVLISIAIAVVGFLLKK